VKSKEQVEIASVVYELVMRDDPSRVLELYYYAREPSVLELIRAIMALERPTRDAIEGFLLRPSDSDTTDAGLDNHSTVVTTARHEGSPSTAAWRLAGRGRKDIH
jgi:hypothetical protein